MIVFCPLRDIAPPDALAPSEWEALGRLAMTIESSGPNLLASIFERTNEAYRAPSHRHTLGRPEWLVPCKIDVVRRDVKHWLLDQMRNAGLNPDEFVRIVDPYYDPQKPAHTHDNDIPERWIVALRMNCPTSAAQKTADTHKPTLSEQHGNRS